MDRVTVVGSSALSERLASKIDATTAHAPGRAPAGAAVVMVASSAADVEQVAKTARGAKPPAAVVAWHLPESALVRLLELNIPCMIGEPEAEQVADALAGGTDGIDHHTERSAAARYAVLESWLNQPAQTVSDIFDR